MPVIPDWIMGEMGLHSCEKFDVIIDEGRDGWTLLATKNGGKHRNTAGGGRKRKSPRARPILCDSGWFRRIEKEAGKCSPLNYAAKRTHVSP